MGNPNDEAIDAAVLLAVNNDWQKIAIIISKVFDDPTLKPADKVAPKISERISILVDHGKLQTQGNIRRWRDGEVKLIG